ncbi:MAG TPA: aldo/keto reductase [Candidatus Limnocylindrales bacterium]|nr:aldo/keto reductase [Candidatus Limnocylindrales bacterium]
MEYRRFGRTDMRVSALALGCGGFGGVGSAPELFGRGEDHGTAFALMDRALEAGITLFDTANSYGGGASETMIGDFLRRRRARDRVILSTKVFNRMGPGPEDAGLSRPAILKAIDGSLRRLQTDYVDLYVTHDDDPTTPFEETLGAFDELVKAGKVRHTGASNLSASRLAVALHAADRAGMARFQSVQNEYNLLNRTAERDVLPLCEREGLAMTPFSPTAGGWLSAKYRAAAPPPPGSRMALRPDPYRSFQTVETYQAIDALVDEARGRGVAPITLALAWVVSHPQVTAAIIGPRRLEHFDTLLPAVELRLTQQERAAIGARMEAHARPVN